MYRSDPSCDGHVVSNGTFSKIFGPGVRMGWIEGPKCVLEKLRQRYTCCLELCVYSLL